LARVAERHSKADAPVPSAESDREGDTEPSIDVQTLRSASRAGSK